MDLPKRKFHRLTGYDYSKDGAYFITICAYKRQNLFGDIVSENGIKVVKPNECGHVVEEWLNNIEDKYRYAKINTYVIMHDHIHFILNIESEDEKNYSRTAICEIIKWFKTQSTNDIIRRIKNNELPSFNKHIWQRDYYDHIIRNEEDLFEIWRYIEDNPTKWGETHM